MSVDIPMFHLPNFFNTLSSTSTPLEQLATFTVRVVPSSLLMKRTTWRRISSSGTWELLSLGARRCRSPDEEDFDAIIPPEPTT